MLYLCILSFSSYHSEFASRDRYQLASAEIFQSTRTQSGLKETTEFPAGKHKIVAAHSSGKYNRSDVSWRHHSSGWECGLYTETQRYQPPRPSLFLCKCHGGVRWYEGEEKAGRDASRGTETRRRRENKPLLHNLSSTAKVSSPQACSTNLTGPAFKSEMSVSCMRMCVRLVPSRCDIMSVDSLALSGSHRVSDVRVVFGAETRGCWVKCGRRKVQLVVSVNSGAVVRFYRYLRCFYNTIWLWTCTNSWGSIRERERRHLFPICMFPQNNFKSAMNKQSTCNNKKSNWVSTHMAVLQKVRTGILYSSIHATEWQQTLA